MLFDHVLEVLKLIVASISSVGSIAKKEKAPAAVVPSSSALAATFDSKDFAILCLGIALVFTTMALLSMAAARR